MGHLEIEAVTIRSATNRYKDKIISLVSDILSEFSLQSDFDTSESDLIDIETTYNKRGGTFNIVENTRKHLLGTFALYPVDKNTCKLRKMYLTKQARGVGLGGKMLDYAIDDARKSGFKAIILETMSVRKDAVHLYTQRGFVLINKQPESPHCELVFALSLVDDLLSTDD